MGIAKQWECYSQELVRAENSLPKFFWKTQDILHRKHQHNFLIKLKSMAHRLETINEMQFEPALCLSLHFWKWVWVRSWVFCGKNLTPDPDHLAPSPTIGLWGWDPRTLF